jgi:hypothetical protein
MTLERPAPAEQAGKRANVHTRAHPRLLKGRNCEKESRENSPKLGLGDRPPPRAPIPKGLGEKATQLLAQFSTRRPLLILIQEYIVSKHKTKMSALFNFESLLLVILLTICTCTYLHAQIPAVMDRNKHGSPILRVHG